jgi:ATP-dependent Clp protease ATP-binding subunit ClpA
MSDLSDRLARVRGLETLLRDRIRGQDHVLAPLAAAFTRGELGLTDPERPRGSFLLVGPTGSGKTETFNCAIAAVFGPDRLVTFDMSEYQHASAIGKLLGDSRDDPGLLGMALAKLPAGGVLFDEIEKAHPLVMDLFLQMLWNGRITVATGQTFRLTNHYVGLTSNLGSEESIRMALSKFASVEQAVLRRLEQTLRPELLARVGDKFVFSRLTSEVQREICELEVRRETSRLCGLGYDVVISRESLELLVKVGFHPTMGARPLRKAVEHHLQDVVVRKLLASS